MNSTPITVGYPYSLILSERVVGLPTNLTIGECNRLEEFLTKHNGILKIEYGELVKISSSSKLLEPDTESKNISSSGKLLRTSRNFPYYTILRKVSELPPDLKHETYRELAEYLDVNSNIIDISYSELCKVVYRYTANPLVSTTPIRDPREPYSQPNINYSNHPNHSNHSNHPTTPCSENNQPTPLKFSDYENELKKENPFPNLTKVYNLPSDLSTDELQRLDTFLSEHSEIWKIGYFELLNRAEPRSPKRKCVKKMNN
jgi:hypothetical protein